MSDRIKKGIMVKKYVAEVVVEGGNERETLPNGHI
jgi:hypothetical protein